MSTKYPYLSLIYQDDYIIIVNKASGLICHPVGNYQGDTLLARLHYYFDKEVRLVHRLDKRTSGIMVAAKSQAIAACLYKQFMENKVSKSYLALVHGYFDKQEGDINLPIIKQKSLDAVIKIKMEVNSEGLKSYTKYFLLGRDDKASLLRLIPYTGRKHQIRLHLAYLGYPVIGDNLYIKQGMAFLWDYYLNKVCKSSYIRKGHCLHSYQLSFQHPVFGNKLEFKAAPPKDWKEFSILIEDFIESDRNRVNFIE